MSKLARPRVPTACLLFLIPLSVLFVSACSGCSKEEKRGGGGDVPPPPPPSASNAKAGACATGGGELTDPVSAGYLPKSTGGYCVDPQGEVKTYGEKGKLSMDEVCTTAFDGECEVYKRFGLKRVVSLHYVDGSGKGGSVEVNLSQFADVAGAYGMYTMRVVAGDPAEPSTPKPFAAGGAGAIGTGRAYVWRGNHLVELQYVNEQESPADLAKSSDTILRAVGKEIGAKLPGATTLPPSAAALPEANRIANGIMFQPKDILGWNGVGPGALGFYKDGDRRWRTLVIFKDDADQAKDAFKTIKSKPGTLPIGGLGDEAAHVVVSGKEGGPKVELLVARKGNAIWGISDEEYALRGGGAAEKEQKARLTKDEAIAKLRPLLLLSGAAPAGGDAGAPPSSASGSTSPSVAPSASSGTKK
ncbi:MAG: hypothetical protein QOI41_3487 [Myxococcales bacterium]|nr:hypothetical protein [Myxococcales bacterium]